VVAEIVNMKIIFQFGTSLLENVLKDYQILIKVNKHKMIHTLHILVICLSLEKIYLYVLILSQMRYKYGTTSKALASKHLKIFMTMKDMFILKN